MEIAQLLRAGVEKLRRCGVIHADIDVQLLLGHCLNMSRTQLFVHGADHVDHSVLQQFLTLIERRASREPVAYILEEREFWSLPFYVNRDVLIPRPETEFLLETVFRKVREAAAEIECCVDLCCGSGVIAVVLAMELNAEVLALDCSAKALAVTRKNSIKHKVAGHVRFLHSDLFSGLPPGRAFPLIVSNPPYVRRDEIEEALEPEVTDFEPHLALDGGPDGLSCIRRIAGEVLDYLLPSGMFFMEFGAEQAAAVGEEFSSVSGAGRYFEIIEILQDYSGRDRVLFAKANNYQE
jgi:release factor glutamine methyltransferase